MGFRCLCSCLFYGGVLVAVAALYLDVNVAGGILDLAYEVERFCGKGAGDEVEACALDLVYAY